MHRMQRNLSEIPGWAPGGPSGGPGAWVPPGVGRMRARSPPREGGALPRRPLEAVMPGLHGGFEDDGGEGEPGEDRGGEDGRVLQGRVGVG